MTKALATAPASRSARHMAAGTSPSSWVSSLGTAAPTRHPCMAECSAAPCASCDAAGPSAAQTPCSRETRRSGAQARRTRRVLAARHLTGHQHRVGTQHSVRPHQRSCMPRLHADACRHKPLRAAVRHSGRAPQQQHRAPAAHGTTSLPAAAATTRDKARGGLSLCAACVCTQRRYCQSYACCRGPSCALLGDSFHVVA